MIITEANAQCDFHICYIMCQINVWTVLQYYIKGLKIKVFQSQEMFNLLQPTSQIIGGFLLRKLKGSTCFHCSIVRQVQTFCLEFWFRQHLLDYISLKC